MAGSPSTVATPAPAATVVLLRPGAAGSEVLLTHRPSTMAFAAGMHVFPGGRVDAADRDPRLADRSVRSAEQAARALGDNLEPSAALALHVAAIRELFEEAGVLLADGRTAPGLLAERRARLLEGESLADALEGIDLRLRTDRLIPIGHWSTPPFMPRRFSTWFFAADLPPGVEPSFVGDEVAAHRWATPHAALEQLATGEVEMWVPTSSTLQHLAASFKGAAGDAAGLAGQIVLLAARPPEIVEDALMVARIVFGAVGGVPGRSGAATLFGREDIVVVDPGDPSEAAIAAINDVVRRRDGSIRAIVLTATHPDQAGGAEILAIPLGIPILVAPGAGRHLPYETREVSDGDRLPTDGDVRVRLGRPGSGRLDVVVRG
jgi:8-oxo-dGTP pyrophosphatase MutT (NUDIX family)